MSDTYSDLSALVNSGEELVGPIETGDFNPGPGLTPVANYISHARTITGKEKNGFLSVSIELTGGVQDPETGKVFNARYPLRGWASTRPFVQEGKPGHTSGVAEYLRACGVNPKGMSKEEVLSALADSQTIPVSVFISRTDRQEKLADGTYSEPLNLKLKAFLKPDGTYADSVEIDGKVVRGKEKVGSFRKI